MDKIERPRGLIAYDTVARQEAVGKGTAHEPLKLVRARTLLYTGLFAIVGLVMLAAYFNRTILEINVLPERSPPYVQLADGSIRNGFTVKILNKLHEPRTMTLAATGLPSARIDIVGIEGGEKAAVTVATDDLRELRVYVTVPAGEVSKLGAGVQPFSFIVRDSVSRTETTRRTNFHAPAGGLAR
jgi:polyferredoxin